MGILKKVFGFIWALWAGFWFMFIITIFTIAYAILFLFTGRKYVRTCIWINCHYLCNTLAALTLVRKRLHGLEKIDKKGTYVFVSNHRAQYDTIIAAGSLPQPPFFLAKAELAKVPVFGYMVKMLAIMVDRKSKESRARSLRVLVDELHKGNSIFLFPEGTRNKTENPLIDFKDGAFNMAIAAQVPVVVLTLVGMRKVNSPKGFQLFPGVIDVHFSAPISTLGLKTEDIPVLKEKVRQEMLSHLERQQKEPN